jgi:phosphatidylinositol glycan class B
MTPEELPPQPKPHDTLEDELTIHTGTALSPRRTQEDRIAAAVMGLILVAGGAVRLWVSARDHGVFQADELQRALEPAHRLAFGYGLPAEPPGGWVFPGMLAALLRVASWFGAGSPGGYLALVRTSLALLGVATALGCAALARKFGVRWISAGAAGALFALMGPAIYLAHRPYAEVAATAPLVLGLACALGPRAHRGWTLLGPFGVGLAGLVYFPCTLFGVGLALILFARRRWRAGFDAVLVIGFLAFVGGSIERASSGTWFAHAAGFVRNFAFWSQGAPLAHAQLLFSAVGPLAAAIGAFALFSAPRAPGLLLLTALAFAVQLHAPEVSLLPFLPILAVACALAGVGVELFVRQRVAVLGRAAAVVALAVAVSSAVTLPRTTLGSFGVKGPTAPLSIFDQGGSENRLLLLAHERRDLCGLQVLTRPLDQTGGFSYLHRNVTLLGPEPGAKRPVPDPRGRVNYLLAPLGEVAGEELAVDGAVALVKLPVESCAK